MAIEARGGPPLSALTYATRRDPLRDRRLLAEAEKTLDGVPLGAVVVLRVAAWLISSCPD